MRLAHHCSRRTGLVGVLCRLFSMNSYAAVARALSAAFVAGELDVDGLVARGSEVFGRRWRWLRPVARRLSTAFSGQTRPRQTAIADMLLADRGFRNACRKHELHVANWLPPPATMCSVPVAGAWSVPSICTAGQLADWLGVSAGELEWFADTRGLEFKRCQERLRHYHYRPVAKRFGSVRLIEAPKPRLKEIQRCILTGILNHIPVHSAAHGFRRNGSIISFSAPHVGRAVVLKIDLQDFFPSIRAARIQALFRTVGYPENVADLLAGLCTNATPCDVWDNCRDVPDDQKRHSRRLYSDPHLPQGAPTSPALANLCAFQLDCRLAGLTRAAGAAYTRYADDLAFSGDHTFSRVVKRFQLHVCATVMEEGFSIHHRKTRIMRQGVRQRLAGIVVNQRPNVPRDQFDRLKATLVNCVRHGPDSQNRSGHNDFRSHLEGRISFVEMVHEAKGEFLRKLFRQIKWHPS
jgi:RNA-directed DNA polymerase